MIETITISTRKISPIASSVPSAPRLFRNVGTTLIRPINDRAPTRWIGLALE